MRRIALCGLVLLTTSGCLRSMPSETVVLATGGPVVDESLPVRQVGRGTDPTAQLARSSVLTTRWRNERAVDFSELDRPTGAPMPIASPSGRPGASAGVEMRAAPPAPRASRDPAVDSVGALDRLETRAKTAARSICDRC